MSNIACFTSFSASRLDAATRPLIASSQETTSLGIVQASLLYERSRKMCQSARWNIFKEANPLRLVWDCTDLHPQDAWRYVQALAFPETAIVLSQSTLTTYSEVYLLPTPWIDNLEGTEQLLANSLQPEISSDKIANQLVNEEVARLMQDFERLLNTIERKKIN